VEKGWSSSSLRKSKKLIKRGRGGAELKSENGGRKSSKGGDLT